MDPVESYELIIVNPRKTGNSSYKEKVRKDGSCRYDFGIFLKGFE
jgi:hypothetical protein